MPANDYAAQMNDHDPTTLTIDDWIAELAIDEEHVPLSDCVPVSAIVASLHETAARIAARKAAGPIRKAARGH